MIVDIKMAEKKKKKKMLGARIQGIRKSLKLTQEQLAERIGMEPQNVSMIETGRNYPTPENLAKIAQTLGVDVFELFIFGEQKSLAAMRKFIISEVNRSSKTTKILFNFCRSINQA